MKKTLNMVERLAYKLNKKIEELKQIPDLENLEIIKIGNKTWKLFPGEKWTVEVHGKEGAGVCGSYREIDPPILHSNLSEEDSWTIRFNLEHMLVIWENMDDLIENLLKEEETYKRAKEILEK